MGNFDSFSREKNEWFNYLTAYDNEKNLYDLMLTEGYNLHGVCLTYYVVSYDKDFNRIWGEDNNRSFERKFDVMSYFELPKEDEQWNKFGIVGLDTFQIEVSQKHFAQASKYSADGVLSYDSYIPKAGDIVKSEYSSFFYEIVEVSQEEEMFLQGKHSWSLSVTQYKNEHISASELDFPEINVINNNDVDMFNIKDDIDEKKTDILFDGIGNNSPFGNW